MKIVHICLNGPYTENWGYQENLLAKHHKALGHEVHLFAGLTSHTQNGGIVELEETFYTNKDGVLVTRLKPKKILARKLTMFLSLYPLKRELISVGPDFIFVHGLIGSIALLYLRKYKKQHPEVRISVDIHQDFYNSRSSKGLKGILIHGYHIVLNNFFMKCVDKLYYVAPSCLLYIEKYYRIRGKTAYLLPLGSDDEHLTHGNLNNSYLLRKKLNIPEDEIVICHGGKITKQKGTQELVDAFIRLCYDYTNVWLIIFGPILFGESEIEYTITNNNSTKLKYLGVLSVSEYMDVFCESDIAVFPGTQSALWQQALFSGLGLLISEDENYRYLNDNGSVYFYDRSKPDSLYKALKYIVTDSHYKQMKYAAYQSRMRFSYRSIAKSTIDDLGSR